MFARLKSFASKFRSGQKVVYGEDNSREFLK